MRWRLLALTAATFALVSACGSNPDGNNKVASLSEAATPSDQQQANDGRSDEDKVRDFTKCMQEHGVDMPEPTGAPRPGGSGGGSVSIEIRGAGEDKEKIDAANEACRSLLPNGGKPPKLDAAQLDEMRKMAQCMREHGVNMPDPDPNNPEMNMDVTGLDDKALEKAFEACGHGPRISGGSGSSSDRGSGSGK